MRARFNDRPVLRGAYLPRIFDGDAPALEVVQAAAAWAGVTITADDWREERARMREAGSLAAYLRIKRTGAPFRVDRCARERLWRIARELRETPARGTIADFRRVDP